MAGAGISGKCMKYVLDAEVLKLRAEFDYGFLFSFWKTAWNFLIGARVTRTRRNKTKQTQWCQGGPGESHKMKPSTTMGKETK